MYTSLEGRGRKGGGRGGEREEWEGEGGGGVEGPESVIYLSLGEGRRVGVV